MRVEEVDAAATADLRRRVLRAGRPHEGFPEDDAPSTFHLAAVEEGGVVGVATFVDRGAGVWQLRGMAVDDEVRGRGAGRAVLAEGLERVRARGGTSVWANGRDTALGFYERLGFTVVGDGYEMSGLPHHRIERDL